jgi:endonuclease YncB( thermonuclease family)
MARQTPLQRLIGRLGFAIVAVVMVAFTVWAATLPPSAPSTPSPLGFQAQPPTSAATPTPDAAPPSPSAEAVAAAAPAGSPAAEPTRPQATAAVPPAPARDPVPASPSVRDITPQSVTPAPAVTAPLVRVPGREPPAPPPERIVNRRLPLVIVEAGGVFRSGAMTIRLAGIAPLTPEQTCTDSQGTAWPCGAQATHALRALVRNRSIQCRMGEKVRTGEHETECQLGRIDLARWLVEQGWADPADPAQYALEAAEARAQGRGRYRAKAASALPAPSGVTAMPDLADRVTVDPPSPAPPPAAN